MGNGGRLVGSGTVGRPAGSGGGGARTHRGYSSRWGEHVDVKFADALARLLEAEGLSVLADREASWQVDPSAYLCGYTLNPAQAELVKTVDDPLVSDVGYGGSVGGGKTWGVMFAVRRYMILHPGAQVLWVRKYKSALEDSVITPFVELCERTRERYGLRFTFSRASRWVLKMHTDPDMRRVSSITFAQADDPQIVQGSNYDLVVVDEAPQLTFAQFEELISRARGSVYNPAGPGGVGKAWKCMTIWMGNQAPGYFYQEYVLRHLKGELGVGAFRLRKFIVSRIDDNIDNLDSEFKNRLLLADTGGKIKRKMEGEWNFDDGTIFGDVGRMVGEKWQAWGQVFCDFDIQEVTGLPRDMVVGVIGYDWGWGHPCAILWGFVHEGTMYVSDEMIAPHVSLAVQASWIKEHRVSVVWADQSTRSMRGKGSDRFIADDFAGLGVFLSPANTGAEKRNVLAGVETMRRAFMAGAVKIHSRCALLRESLMRWQYKRRSDGTLDTGDYEEQYKDGVDALRYMVLCEYHRLFVEGRGSRSVDARTGEKSLPSGPVLSERQKSSPVHRALFGGESVGRKPGAFGASSSNPGLFGRFRRHTR